MIAALFFVVVVGVVFWSEVAVQGVVFEREVRASKADAVAVFDVANQEQGHIGDFLSSPLRQLGSVGVGWTRVVADPSPPQIRTCGFSCALGFSWTLDCERVLAGGVSR